MPTFYQARDAQINGQAPNDTDDIAICLSEDPSFMWLQVMMPHTHNWLSMLAIPRTGEDIFHIDMSIARQVGIVVVSTAGETFLTGDGDGAEEFTRQLGEKLCLQISA